MTIVYGAVKVYKLTQENHITTDEDEEKKEIGTSVTSLGTYVKTWNIKFVGAQRYILIFNMLNYYMLKYLLRCAHDWTAGAHFSEYLNSQWW